MLEKRIKHQRIIIKQKKSEEAAETQNTLSELPETTVPQEEADEEMVQEAFSTVVAQKKRVSRKPFDPNQSKKRKLASQPTRDEENYIRYMSKDHQTESG